jgi:hypothetical protein
MRRDTKQICFLELTDGEAFIADYGGKPVVFIKTTDATARVEHDPPHSVTPERGAKPINVGALQLVTRCHVDALKSEADLGSEAFDPEISDQQYFEQRRAHFASRGML